MTRNEHIRGVESRKGGGTHPLELVEAVLLVRRKAECVLLC